MIDRLASGLLLLDQLNDALRHPLHGIRPASAAPAVNIQFHLRYAAYAEPLLRHLLLQLPLPVEWTVDTVANIVKAINGPTPLGEAPFLAACVLKVTLSPGGNAGLIPVLFGDLKDRSRSAQPPKRRL